MLLSPRAGAGKFAIRTQGSRPGLFSFALRASGEWGQSPITHFLNRVPKIAPSRFEVIGAARVAAFLLNLRMSSEAAFRRGARFLRSHSPGDVFLYVCPGHIQSQFQGTDRGKIAQ